MKLLKKGNIKIANTTAIFSLPAVDTCGRHCKGCYAYIAQKRFKNVAKGRNNRWEYSKTDKFVEKICEELKSLNPRFVRIHESGDFYSQEYLDKWVEIARKNPSIVFYAYTKQDHLDFSKAKETENLVIHKSILPDGSLNFDKPEVLEKKIQKFGGFICPLSHDRTKKCGEECTWCMEKVNEGTPIYFERH